MNKVELVGNLTRDWDRDDNNRFIKNSIALNGYNDKVDFVNIVSFNEKMMDNIENYTHKGSKVAIIGRISTNKKDDRTYTSVVIENIEFLNSKTEPGTPIKDVNKGYTSNDEYNHGDLDNAINDKDDDLWA